VSLGPGASPAPARPPFLGWLETPNGNRWFQRLVWTLVAVGLLVALLVGADRPADPHLLDPAALAATAAHSTPSRVPGFRQVGFRIVDAAKVGMGRSYCALLADTLAQQERGLMGRRNLAGYDAMIFRFSGDTTVPFYNKNVPIPVTVSWFDAAGIYVGSADLAVCSDPCPTVSPPIAYRYALEVPAGGLHHLGIHAGSLLLVGGACT
jgi:uncharacterized membrane protein (UPF0127 family)